jgi:RNA polymerase sigma factor (TIGR02999 family)
MSDVTLLIEAAQAGDPKAAADLLPLVYAELRKLADVRLAAEKPGQTLQATALVHEAYLRLVGPDVGQGWDNRGHFFAAAAEAMRRILIDIARRKGTAKRGGRVRRVDLSDAASRATAAPDEVLLVDEALDGLADEDLVAAQLVKLRYYVGLSVEEAGTALGLSRTAAYDHWAYGRAWLQAAVARRDDNPQSAGRGSPELRIDG